MFTGIIEEVGKIKSVSRGRASSRLTISGKKIFDDLKIGDSVAVSGVCLTADEIGSDWFAADVMHETLNRTILGSLAVGDSVNLERAVKLGGRLGGHIVTGHIDGAGVIADIKKDDNAVIFKIKVGGGLARQIAEKGSVAIDGISLTVASVAGGMFTVSVIPHTAENTALNRKKIGSRVNIETDCIAKYIDKMLSAPGSSGMTREFLAWHGY